MKACETGNEKILKEVIKKSTTKDDIRRAVKIARNLGIKVRCFFTLGHLGETRETIKETVDFALELNPDALSFGLMVPIPGSEFRELAEQGKGGLKINKKDWTTYNQFSFDCVESETLSNADLKRLRADALMRFYFHHPGKALKLFFDKSSYNYNLKSFFKLIGVLLKQRFVKK